MIGDIISAGANIIGGIMGSNSAEKAREHQMQIHREQIGLQREFAERGISWKVNDAKNAGIHPIFALGGSGATYTPQSTTIAPDMSMANAMSRAGQDIGRAVNATQNAATRVDAFTAASQALTLERGKLENDVLKADLASRAARLRQQINPPMPVNQRYLVPGQAETATGELVKSKPMEQTPSDPRMINAEPGANPDVGYLRTSGGLFPAPGDQAKQRIEDNWYQESMHFLRNNLLPMVAPAFNDPPKGVPLKEGHAWVYDPIYGYKQVPDKWYRKFIRY